MHSITFSLAPLEPRPTFTDTAQDTVRAISNMSTQTKQRLELLGLVLGLLLTLASAVKVFVFLPPRVDTLEKTQAEQAADLKVIQAKASATDVAIAGIVPQLTAINQGIGEIKADVRDIRNAK